MANDTVANQLLERNRVSAVEHQPIPYFSELPSLGLDMPHTLILTCADPRLAPEKFLDLGPVGPIFIRNVCGHVTPALNDIVALDRLVTIDNLLIIHHTDCGSLAFQDEEVRADLKKRVPEKSKEIEGMSFGAITDVEQSVKDDLAVLRTSPFVRRGLAERSVGFVYDLKTGVLSPVEV